MLNTSYALVGSKSVVFWIGTIGTEVKTRPPWARTPNPMRTSAKWPLLEGGRAANLPEHGQHQDFQIER